MGQEAGKCEPILIEVLGTRSNREAGGGALLSLALSRCAVCAQCSGCSHGGQRQRERYRRSGEQQLGHAAFVLFLHRRSGCGPRRQAGRVHLCVSAGGADEPPGVPAAGEQSAEDRAGDAEAEVQVSAGGEPRPAQGQRHYRESPRITSQPFIPTFMCPNNYAPFCFISINS